MQSRSATHREANEAAFVAPSASVTANLSGPELLPIDWRRQILGHTLVSVLFVLLFLLLNRPEVIFFSRIGLVAWYPAIGLSMALMLGVSPWYALLVCISGALAGTLIYGAPAMSFGNTIDAMGAAACYGAAAYVLRGPLQIDFELRRRRDVVRFVLVSAMAAAVATIIGVACLIADRSITPGEYRSATVVWFLGDAVGLVGIAPFLLVHIFPHVRNWFSTPASQRAVVEAHPTSRLGLLVRPQKRLDRV